MDADRVWNNRRTRHSRNANNRDGRAGNVGGEALCDWMRRRTGAQSRITGESLIDIAGACAWSCGLLDPGIGCGSFGARPAGRPGNRGQIQVLRSGFERGVFPMRQPVIGRFDMGRVLFLDIAFEFNQKNNNHDSPEIQIIKIVVENFSYT